MTSAIDIAQRVIQTEIQGLEALAASLSQDFEKAVTRLNALTGRVILTGVGKSGHVARKIAATLASTGTPSIYIHPTEASHGDMGMITQDDAIIALSRSGETRELSDMIAFSQRFDIPLIAITADAKSTLAQAAHHALILPDAPEACAETRAPTTSTTLQMALGLLTVHDLMHSGADLPLITHTDSVANAVKIMSAKGFGCVGVCKNDHLVGIITDGDIRRHLTGSYNIARKAVSDIMTSDPKTAMADDLAATALRRMTEGDIQIMQLFVTQDERPIGIVHMHDFLKAGLA